MTEREHFEELVQQGDAAAVVTALEALPAAGQSRVVAQLSPEQRAWVLDQLDSVLAAALVEGIPEVLVADSLELLEPGTAAAIFEALPSDERADLLGDLDKGDAEAILARMRPETAAEASMLSAYADDVAGGLMVTEYLHFPETTTVGQVRDDLMEHAERYRNYQVQYIYVVDAHRRLTGVLRLRDLMFANAADAVVTLMIRTPKSVLDTTTLDSLRDFFAAHAYYGVPVVDADGALLGLVQRADVEQAQAERTGTDFLKTQGIVGGEELRSMPLARRAGRRLSWLTINVGLNILAASVIALYQETLQAAIALAVFLPIISDMSGCSGNQAVAVSMRELTLGLVRTQDTLRVWSKEVLVGLVNGLALGLLVAAAAWLWKGDVRLGLVVGVAMAANTVLAVSLGGTLPLLLRGLRIDPALASGPVLTTLTDMCGFLLVLSLASAFLV